jgi:hypothetical protein
MHILLMSALFCACQKLCLGIIVKSYTQLLIFCKLLCLRSLDIWNISTIHKHLCFIDFKMARSEHDVCFVLSFSKIQSPRSMTGFSARFKSTAETGHVLLSFCPQPWNIRSDSIKHEYFCHRLQNQPVGRVMFALFRAS